MTSACAQRMAEVAAALATPSEKGTAQTLAIVADLLAENASLKQKQKLRRKAQKEKVGDLERQLEEANSEVARHLKYAEDLIDGYQGRQQVMRDEIDALKQRIDQKDTAASEERIHSGVQLAALENVIKERDASIKHLVELRETANSKLAKATAELTENRAQMTKITTLTESDQEQRTDILNTISTLEQTNAGLKHSLDIRTDQRDALDSVCDGLRAQIAMLTANHRRTLRDIPHWLHLPGEPVDHASRLRSRGYTAEEIQEISTVAEWHGRPLNPPSEYFTNFPDSDSDEEDNLTDVDERGCVTRP